MPKKYPKSDPFLYSSEDEEEEDECKTCLKSDRDSYFMEYLRDSTIHSLKYIGQVQEAYFARFVYYRFDHVIIIQCEINLEINFTM